MSERAGSDQSKSRRRYVPGLSEYAASYVRDLVTSRALAPGERVHPEDVAAELGISPTPAREALQALRSEGFLELRARRGFTVAQVDGADIRDIFLVQAMVAGELAARAVQQAEDADLEELSRLHANLVKAVDAEDLVAVEECNHEFHRRINLVAGGGRLAWTVRMLSRWAPRRFYASIPGWVQTTIEDHEGILNALLTRDAEQARALMAAHLVRAGDLLAEHFDKHLASTG